MDVNVSLLAALTMLGMATANPIVKASTTSTPSFSVPTDVTGTMSLFAPSATTSSWSFSVPPDVTGTMSLFTTTTETVSFSLPTDGSMSLVTPTDVTGSMSLFTPPPTPTTPTSPQGLKKELSICCCCMSEPQPETENYMAECPRAGVQAVCGADSAGDSDYTLGGIEGQPEEIAKVCSTVRCGPVIFVD